LIKKKNRKSNEWPALRQPLVSSAAQRLAKHKVRMPFHHRYAAELQSR